MSTDRKPAPGTTEAKVEGEGSYTATRAYNKDTEDFIKSGKVEQAAQAAAQAVQGAEREDLEKAEAAGKSHSHGEDPALAKAPKQK